MITQNNVAHRPKDIEAVVMLIRHGESLANAAGIYLGHTDWDLSERGYAQAEESARHLADCRIDAVYSSDLIRAYHTVLPHAQMRGLEVVCSRGLREIYLGDWEGRAVSSLDEEYPESFSVGWRKNFGTCQPPNGESVCAVGERITAEVERIASENLGKIILIGCHAAAIRSFWGRVNNINPASLADAVPFPKNASLTTVAYRDGKIVPLSFGDDEYLKNKK